MTSASYDIAPGGTELRSRQYLRQVLSASLSSPLEAALSQPAFPSLLKPTGEFAAAVENLKPRFHYDAATTGLSWMRELSQTTERIQDALRTVSSSANTNIVPGTGHIAFTAPAPAVGTSSDVDDVVLHQVTAAITSIFQISRDESFESGIDNNLSVGLRAIYLRHPYVLLKVLSTQLRDADSESILIESLRTLGSINHPATQKVRVSLIAHFLNHPSAIVRDASALALSFLDERGAIPYLKRAIERERLQSIRTDMQSIIDELQ